MVGHRSSILSSHKAALRVRFDTPEVYLEALLSQWKLVIHHTHLAWIKGLCKNTWEQCPEKSQFSFPRDSPLIGDSYSRLVERLLSSPQLRIVFQLHQHNMASSSVHLTKGMIYAQANIGNWINFAKFYQKVTLHFDSNLKNPLHSHKNDEIWSVII